MVGLDNLRLVSIYKEKKTLNWFRFSLFELAIRCHVGALPTPTIRQQSFLKKKHSTNNQRRRKVQPPTLHTSPSHFKILCAEKLLAKLFFWARSASGVVYNQDYEYGRSNLR